MKKKYLLGMVFLFASLLLLIGWVIGTYINYHSVHKKKYIFAGGIKNSL